VYRFALIYFLLYVGLGTYVPWMPPFLESRGMSAAAIGMALASVQLARAVLPPAWGFLADRLHLRRGLFIASTLAAAASLLSLTLPGGASSLTARLALYGAVVVPAMPLLETLTLAGLKGERQRYGPVRLWGSIGFIVSAWGVGSLVPAVGVALVPWACALPLLLGAGWAVAALPRAPAAPLHQSPRLSELPWAELMPMVAAAAMTQMSHGPYYASGQSACSPRSCSWPSPPGGCPASARATCCGGPCS
jgi:PPP family 3-phenylpropionic acid transporter